MSHDQALRRRLRDEQRPMTYREAVLCGRRRPWTAKQLAAATEAARLKSAVDDCRYEPDMACGAVLCLLGHERGSAVRSHWLCIEPEVDEERTWPRIYAWATRVLAETAELEGTP